ncbi:MAG TPA: hypothetical protein VMD58_10295 [Acidobacteriaceae bacterium]|nr:hypothetical protein [Acidobacteriaceae bacterium]
MEVRSQTQSSSRLFTILLAAWTALLLWYLAVLFIAGLRVNDQSMYLYFAQHVLSGVHISGPQLVEVDPPMVIWFSIVPVLLARLLHLSPYLMLKVVVFLMVVASVSLSGRILRVAGIAGSRTLLFPKIASILTAEIFMTGYVLGEHEHLLVILILPYVLSAAADAGTRIAYSELCAIGLIAGIGVCFKPQQVLLLIALELFLAAWTRSLRRLLAPDFLCAMLAVFTYIAAVSIAAPLYFTATIPLLRDTYWGMGTYSTGDLIKQQPVFDVLFVLAVLAFIFIVNRKKSRLPVIPGAFLACSLGACIAYCAQHYPVEYRAYPQRAFLLLAVLWIAMELTPVDLAASWRPNSAFAVSALIFTLLLLPLSKPAAGVLGYVPYNWRVPDTVFAQYSPQTPVLLISITPDAPPAVLRDHLIWASRFAHFWMLPAIIRNERFEAGGPKPKRILPPALVSKLALLTRTETAEDFRRWKPSVVIVQQCQSSKSDCLGLAHLDFDPLAWFLKSPAFAVEWSHYRLQTTYGNYDVYTRTN